MMTRTINALSDRLLRIFVPRASAQAEPCGPLDLYLCNCTNVLWFQWCCRYSGSCYPCRPSQTPC
jgi:hypothetical protein